MLTVPRECKHWYALQKGDLLLSLPLIYLLLLCLTKEYHTVAFPAQRLIEDAVAEP
jgi:hypothetical protein